MTTLSADILSDITVFTKYAKHLPDKNRRESFDEIVDRNRDMHLKKFQDNKELCKEIKTVYKDFVKTKRILPSMRSMQFGGKPIELSPNRIYNCCFLPVDDYRAFSESMFLLLGGTGVGYSVQANHVEKLPEIRKPTKSRRFLVGDSIEGWADAVKALLQAYMDGRTLPRFDFSDIRAKGEALVTSGGKAPGPQPLKDCLHNMKSVLDAKADGSQLTTLEVHDIMCYIADAVLAGGIRRAALICLFDMDDEDMLTCKFGNWWERNPQRGRANNSAVILRHKVKKKDFLALWEKIKASGAGEPGFYLTNNAEWGTNPCCEIALRPFQFCNLCEVNMGTVESQEDLNERSKAAAFIGTLQASYTDFHYLRDIWKRTTERDALIGVSGTGIASGAYKDLDLKEAAEAVKTENARVADIIGINHAARTTCVKPAGTSSMVLGTSSGIHGWHSDYYVRRMRLGKNEAIYQYLNKKHPELVEDEYFKPQSQAVVSIPIEAPKGAIYRTESPLDLLERVRRFSEEWIQSGHVKGDNSHNVSATISLKDEEWDDVGKWMWENRESYNGLSVLPYDGGTYIQAPFEEISRQKYHAMLKSLTDVNLKRVKEAEDNTDLSGEVACAGGLCEINL
jgi:ribonucleoside-diphosphate reductase alpha chain